MLKTSLKSLTYKEFCLVYIVVCKPFILVFFNKKGLNKDHRIQYFHIPTSVLLQLKILWNDTKNCFVVFSLLYPKNYKNFKFRENWRINPFQIYHNRKKRKQFHCKECGRLKSNNHIWLSIWIYQRATVYSLTATQSCQILFNVRTCLSIKMA